MSVWSYASGHVWIKKCSGYSLREGLRQIYDEIVWESFQESRGEDRIFVEFKVAICLDSAPAMDALVEWARRIKAADPSAQIDFTAEIRVLL